ncbi:carbohydrate ABC transporter permease [Tomitella cavernea]|uniref:Sugar ABC transporter permease n=1 Tax=Tomitella cavernea TaxID=1387982 RepID=A0ABP9C374_9ACTN|nr:sugar ABC transporter permease [Tomitella cavernea]
MAGSAEADDARAAAGVIDSGRGARADIDRSSGGDAPGGGGPGGVFGRLRARVARFDRRLIWFVGPTVLVLAAIIGYPVVRAAYMSFQQDKGLDPDTGMFVQGGFAGLSNYKMWLLGDCGSGAWSCVPGTLGHDFWPAVGITFFFAVITVSVETVLGIWMATVMGRSFLGRSLLRAAVLIPWAIPTAVTAKLWAFIFAPDGIANKIIGHPIAWTTDPWASRFAVIIADVWKTTPFMALLILAGLQMIPNELYEAARVDGASAWQRFTRITLPLVKPALMVAVLFRTMDALRMYDLPAILTGDSGASPTTTMSILVTADMRQGNFNSASALSTLVFIIIFIVAFILVKFLGANAVRTQDEQRKGGAL